MEAPDPLYREIILEHWRHPQNYGTLPNPSFDVTGNNPLCGDHIHLTGFIAHNTLEHLNFTAQACALCTASASLVTEYVTGKTLSELHSIWESDWSELAELNITEARLKCVLLPEKTLKKALEPFIKELL